MISSGGISDLNTIGLDAYVNVLLTTGTPSIKKASSNISSITDRAVGKFSINFGTPLASTDGSVASMPINGTAWVFEDVGVGGGSARTTSKMDIGVYTNAYADLSFMLIFTGA